MTIIKNNPSKSAFREGNYKSSIEYNQPVWKLKKNGKIIDSFRGKIVADKEKRRLEELTNDNYTVEKEIDNLLLKK